MPPSSSRRLAVSACALALLAPFASVVAPRALAAGAPALDGTRSPRALLVHGDALVIVALFSLPGCPWCEVVRRNYLRHLEGAVPGVRVAEYGIGDERPFERTGTGDDTPQNASALAKSLGIRVSPTVAFLDDENRELAERLVGYDSPDFYGAYLDARIAGALKRAADRRSE